jgi:hypothetical protein
MEFGNDDLGLLWVSGPITWAGGESQSHGLACLNEDAETTQQTRQDQEALLSHEELPGFAALEERTDGITFITDFP